MWNMLECLQSANDLSGPPLGDRKASVLFLHVFIYYLWISHYEPLSLFISKSFQVCPNPGSSLTPKMKKEKGKRKKDRIKQTIKQNKSNLCSYSDSHWSMIKIQYLKIQVVNLLKKTESFSPIPLSRVLTCGELHFSIHNTTFKSSLPWCPV